MSSRLQESIDILSGKNDAWAAGMLVLNIPTIILENDFVRSLCVACNGALVSLANENEAALHKFDLSRNR